MKKLYSALFILIFYSITVSSQSFEWAQSMAINYSLNPSMPKISVATDPSGNVITVRLDSNKLAYGQDLYGNAVIESRTSAGIMQWQFNLSDSVNITQLITGPQGEIYAGGSFMGTINLDNQASMINTLGNLWPEDFIIKISSTGTLIWNRNISPGNGYFTLDVLGVDLNGNLWYSTGDFSDSKLIMTDNSGQGIDSLIQLGALWISSFSFDQSGNIYVSGAAEIGQMTLGTLSITIPEQYVMYVARYNSNHQATWAHIAHDITFQHPQVKADSKGNVYLAGNFYQGLSWGNISFTDPQWSQDFFVVKADSSGNFLWGRQTPFTSSGITGRLTLPEVKMLAVDANDNVILFGNMNGTIDWGNGVIGTAGTQLSNDLLHVVSFDELGTAIWQKTGGTIMGNNSSAIVTGNAGECYIAASISGAATFDTITVNNAPGFAFVVVKINYSNVTGIGDIMSDKSGIFPNPAIEKVFLADAWINKKVFISDNQGRIIAEVLNLNGVLNTSELSEGIYILTCENSPPVKLIVSKVK
jgi:hypothetical protein